MNRKKLITHLFVIATLNGMDEPPGRRDVLLITQNSVQHNELQLPSGDPDQDLVEFLNLKSGMSDLKGKIIQERIARKLNPIGGRLASLDPKLARTTSKDLQEFFCQSTILDGIYRFDQAQEKLGNIYPNHGSLVANAQEHDQYLDIETQELEALCIFISAYEKECFDAFHYIIPTLDSILLIEQKRKALKGSSYAISSKLLEFRNRLIVIAQTEERRKNGHRAAATPKKIEPDFNKAGEYYARAQKTVSLAREYEKKIIENKQFQLTAAAYCDLDALYCMAVKKIIKSFYLQPNQEEKMRIFREIQDYLTIIQQCQKKRVELGYYPASSAIFKEIYNFVTNNASVYSVAEPQESALQEYPKNILQKIFALVKKPFTKK